MGKSKKLFEVHHGGHFVGNMPTRYDGEEVCNVNNVDPETVTWDILVRMVERLGYGGGFKLYWKKKGKTLDNGLNIMYNDSGVLRMLKECSRTLKIELYVDHYIDNPIQNISDDENEAEVAMRMGKQTEESHGVVDEAEAEVARGKRKQTEESHAVDEDADAAEVARGKEKETEESHDADGEEDEAEFARGKWKKTEESHDADDEAGQMSEMDNEGPRDDGDHSCSSEFEGDDDLEEDDDTFFNVQSATRSTTTENLEPDMKRRRFDTEVPKNDKKRKSTKHEGDAGTAAADLKRKKRATEEEDVGAFDVKGSILDVNSEYEDSDELKSWDSDDGEPKTSAFPEFRKDIDMLNPELSVGMEFATLADFRALLQEHAVKKKYDYLFLKRD